MPTPTEALADLLTVLDAVPGVGAFRGDQLGTLRTPATVVGMPTVRWETYCATPTLATFRVAIVVSLDEFAMDRLLALLPAVQLAIEATGATVVEAVPVPFDSPLGAAGMASFELITEYPL